MGHRTERRCIRCDLEPGYNRAVVDLVSGLEIGALCRDCDADELEDALPDVDAGRTSSDSCGVCSRDGFFALPLWLPRTERRGGAIVSSVEYEVTEETLTLCDEHFHDLLSGALEAPPEVRTKRERR